MTEKQFEAYYDEYMKQWTVRNVETLGMYPVTSENMANEFTKLLNKKVILMSEKQMKVDESIEDTIKNNLSEWNSLINELSSKEVKLFNKKETYNALSEEIIQSTDFKTLYGKNNESIRKTHVKETLAEEYYEIKELEFSIDYLKRRISFLKSLIYFKTVSMEFKENE